MKLFAWLNRKEYEKKRQMKMIAASPYFDAKWYYEQNPDVQKSGMDAVKHYLNNGWKEGRNPSPNFNSKEYLRQHPELMILDINPLVYYLAVEKKMFDEYKLSISPKKIFFDTRWYSQQYPDYIKETISPYKHYLKYGWKKGYNPSKDFDTNFYLKMYPDVAKSGINPLLHFMHKGYAERRLPKLKVSKKYYSASYLLIAKSEYFDKRWYIKHNPDLDFRIIDPVEHYMRYGWEENRNPSKNFSNEDYFINNPDVEVAHVNPLLHYERHGRKEGRVIVKENLYHAYGGWYEVLRRLGRFIYKEKFQRNKDVKILVHLHMFYANAWSEIKEYLQNLDCYDYELIVTGNSSFIYSDTAKEIKMFKPQTRFVECEDRGFDIGPFMQILQQTDLEKYDLVYHLHSKGATYGNGRVTYNRMFRGTSWFRQLFSGCLGVFNVHRGIDILSENNDYGIIGADNLVLNDTPDRQRVVREYAKRMGIKVNGNYSFIGGSCLGMRGIIAQKIKHLGLKLNNFDFSKRHIFTLAHAMERIISIVGENIGYRIYPLPVKYNNYDKYVKKHLEKLAAQDGIVSKKLAEYGVSNVVSLNMDIVSGIHCTFYKGFYQNRDVFIKWGGNQEVAANEVKMQRIFCKLLPEYVPQILFNDEETPFIVTPYLQGYNLQELYNLGLYEKEKRKILQGLSDIKNKLRYAKVIHRDIRPANLFFSNDKLFLLDCQFAANLKDDYTIQELDYVQNHPNIARVLGDVYRESRDTWNDIFSINLIINEIRNIQTIDKKDMKYQRRKEKNNLKYGLVV